MVGEEQEKYKKLVEDWKEQNTYRINSSTLRSKIVKNKEYSMMVKEKFKPMKDPNVAMSLEALHTNLNKSQLDLSRIKEKIEVNKNIGKDYLKYAKAHKKSDYEIEGNKSKTKLNKHRIHSSGKDKSYIYTDSQNEKSNGLGSKTKSAAQYPNYLRSKPFIINIYC